VWPFLFENIPYKFYTFMLSKDVKFRFYFVFEQFYFMKTYNERNLYLKKKDNNFGYSSIYRYNGTTNNSSFTRVHSYPLFVSEEAIPTFLQQLRINRAKVILSVVSLNE